MKCCVCNKETGKKWGKYCSAKCYNRAYFKKRKAEKDKIKRYCVICHKEIDKAVRGASKVCSKECQNKRKSLGARVQRKLQKEKNLKIRKEKQLKKEKLYRINSLARSLNLSYGQYVAMTEQKERKKNA